MKQPAVTVSLHDLDAIADALARTLSPTVMSPDMIALAVHTMRALGRGQPVAPAAVAGAANRPMDVVQDLLTRLQAIGMAEIGAEGRIVGMILSLGATPHHFQVEGRTLYTWCAIDTLFMPAVLGRTARVESLCPITRTPVRLVIGPDGIEGATPRDAHVSLIVPGVTPGVTPACGPALVGASGSFCTNVRFLATGDAARRWRDAHAGSVVLTLNDAFRLARRVWAEPFLAYASA